MKLLIISQHYWPENFRITDIAESLAKQGHQVTVLCGLPNYPKGFIFDEYKHQKNRTQIHNGVIVFRVKEIGRRNNLLFRFLNYWSYPFYASKMIKKLDRDFDLVLINEVSPIMVAKPAIKYGKRYHKPVIMYEMDLWPESLLAGRISKDSLIFNYYKKLSSHLYLGCNKILTATKEHIDYIKALTSTDELDIHYLPQYAEQLFEYGEYDNVDNGIIDIVFAGNIGKAQSIDSIIKCAHLLNNQKCNNVLFHIVGDGSELENAKSLVNNLGINNILFYGKKPLEEMSYYYKLADAMIVSLEDKPYARMTIPGKVQSYMAAGKPVIGIISGSCNNFIINNEIGYVCEAEDYSALADIVSQLNYDELVKVGSHAREVYFKKYSKNLFMNSLTKHLEDSIVEYKERHHNNE